MISSFKDRRAQAIYERRSPGKGFPSDPVKTARRRVVLLDEAETLGDLAKPPGNRLEALRGDRAGQYAIRINDQWRICFLWTGSDAEDVEIVFEDRS
jgi:proteic killer suppression protein